MKRILIVQSRRRPEMVAGEQDEYRRAVGEQAKLSFISSLDETQPWYTPEEIIADHDAVFFGGSGEFDFDGGRTADDPARTTSRDIRTRVAPLVEALVREDHPFLGICYGHQIVAEVLSTPVVNDHEQKKTGTYAVRLSEEGARDALFAKMPDEFLAQYGHKDSLSALPNGAVLLATGATCRFSALRYGIRGYTTQFHPELTAEDVSRKLAHSPGYLPEGVVLEDIIKPSPDASTLISRFIGLL